MFKINEDLSIYATRGDIVFFSVTAEDEGVPHVFKPGDVVRIKIYGKKDATAVALQKDFPVLKECESVDIYLSREDTKIGGVINKPKDYWYEVVLNDDTKPQTIIGYDEDGAKVFKLFPEGKDLTEYIPPTAEDIPIVDTELDLLSPRPVQNQAIARAVVSLQAAFDTTKEEVAEKNEETKQALADTNKDVAVERSRIDNLISRNTAVYIQDLNYLESISADTRAKIDGKIESDGVVATVEVTLREANLIYGGSTLDVFIIPPKCRPIELGLIHEHDGLEYRIGYDTKASCYYLSITAKSNETVAPSSAGRVTMNYQLGYYEVKDVRVSADGVVYDSAGNSVRSQFDNVQSNQRLNCEKGKSTFYPFAGWRVGGLMSAQPTAHKNRIMSSKIMCFDRDIKIQIAEGFRIGVHRVTADGVFVSDSNWRQNEYIVESGMYFKMVVARVTEDTTENANITELSNAVTFDTLLKTEINKVEETVDRHTDLIRYVAESRSIDAKGAYYTTGGIGLPNNRIHATDIVCDGFAVVTCLDPNQEYFYGVDLYTNDGRRTQISTSGWMRTKERPIFIVEQKCIIDLSVAKITGESFDALSEMDGLFNVAVYDTLSSVRGDMEKLGGTRGRKKSWLTSAHQGFVDSTLRPNSLAAFYNAYLNGADMIETDARLSSDGVLIVCHDPTVTGTNANGESITYTISQTTASDICALTLTNGDKWGVQKVPTLEQVLNLAYHTGMIVNIDIKNGLEAVDKIVDLVAKCGMLGRVIYAPNGTGAVSIGKILAKDPNARFIDVPSIANHVANNPELVGKCYAYTADVTKADEIRASGCLVALISLNASNFRAAIAQHPDMCEYLHNSNFREIEDAYFDELKLY